LIISQTPRRGFEMAFQRYFEARGDTPDPAEGEIPSEPRYQISSPFFLTAL